MYRGITLSPVISKLFESVLLGVYEDYSDSDNLQFVFLNSSCNHAMFVLHESIQYYTKYGAKVFGGFLMQVKLSTKCYITVYYYWTRMCRCR